MIVISSVSGTATWTWTFAVLAVETVVHLSHAGLFFPPFDDDVPNDPHLRTECKVSSFVPWTSFAMLYHPLLFH